MEHSDSLKSIIKYAFDIAIKKSDMVMIDKCLSEGMIVTSKTIDSLRKIILIDIDELESDDDYEQIPIYVMKRRKIFEFLVKNHFENVTDNINFMLMCVMHSDPFYIKSIIDLGYNGNHPKASELLKRIIFDDPDPNCLKILLDNGFRRHIQSLLMFCVEQGEQECLSLFITYGANCYSILHDLHIHVSLQLSCRKSMCDSIYFVLENMYHIKMLREPVCKYFLIKSINYCVPIEIFVYVLKLYMSLDYECSDDIRAKLPGLIPKGKAK